MTALHPQAQTLNLLIIAEGQQHHIHDAFEYAVYRVIDKYLGPKGWPDAKRADLYAQLAEKYKPTGRIIENERIVSAALWSTENNWATQ